MPRRRWMAWAALGAAFLGFELVVDLSTALVAQCLLFGWNDMATAWWCVRCDPIRSRGWLAAGLYAIPALLKVGVWTFGVFGLTASIADSVIALARGEPALLMGLVFVAMGSLIAAWGLANLTCGVALWRRRRLWFGPEARLARMQGAWPPWAADDSSLNRIGPTNQVNFIVWLAFIPWMIVLILVVLSGVGSLLGNAVAANGVAELFAILTIVSIIAVGVFTLRRIPGRLEAASPFEAWELEAP